MLLYHPYLVHFPIAFFLLEALLVLIWARTRNAKYQDFAYLTFRLGLVATVVAMIAGYVDAGGLNPMVRTHFYSALCLLVVNLVRWALFGRYRWNLYTSRTLGMGWFLLLVSVALVIATGHLGGELVYS